MATIPQENLETAPKISEKTVENLANLLSLLNIEKAYYIDDYNRIDELPILSYLLKKIFSAQQIDTLKQIFEGLDLNYNVPDEDAFGEEIAKIWEGLGTEMKRVYVEKIHQHNDGEFNPKDYCRTKELKEHFPENSLELLTPDEWDETFEHLKNELGKDKNVLLLFDQDLKKATKERYSNGTTKGQNLVLEVKQSAIKENAFCALITHLIENTSKELEERDRILSELNAGGKVLDKKDFLALTKERIQNPELLCDGIKKTLLNPYFEKIKEESITVLEKTQIKVKSRIETLDTYDFDLTVLRSSYTEGVWEMETLFRIINNIQADYLKQTMSELGYSKKVNPDIKKSKAISDITFEVNTNEKPYLGAYELRHQDIYVAGELLNKLHMPIENGDIFEVTEGKGKGLYILVAQECDLMMRSDGKRNRDTNTATLIKITPYSIKLDHEITDFKGHYFANKFKLDYFNKGTTEFGVVKFNNAFTVNLNVLDLCVYSNDGASKLNVDVDFDKDLVSKSWEERYNQLRAFFKKQADECDTLFEEIDRSNLNAERASLIKKSKYVKIFPMHNFGKETNYADRTFDFGLKRVIRFKHDGASYLLDRYYKHLSRKADAHDFAREK